jgi:hypothetical protein
VKKKKETTPNAAAEKAVSQAIRMLRAAGVQYAVIDHAGALHGTLDVKKRKYPAGPRMALKPHYKDPLDALAPDSAVSIPIPAGADATSFQACVCQYARALWGMGNYTSSMNREQNAVDVLRFGEDEASEGELEMIEDEVYSEATA